MSGFEDTILKKQQEAPLGLQAHMKAVAEMASSYAKEVGYDEYKAYWAGMAHDLMRAASDDEIIAAVDKADIKITEVMRSLPMLAHGPAAAAWLTEHVPNIDTDILLAVRDHTFPGEDAPLLTQIIAVADTLEPSRHIPERESVRLAVMPFAIRFKKVLELKKNDRRHR